MDDGLGATVHSFGTFQEMPEAEVTEVAAAVAPAGAWDETSWARTASAGRVSIPGNLQQAGARPLAQDLDRLVPDVAPVVLPLEVDLVGRVDRLAESRGEPARPRAFIAPIGIRPTKVSAT